MTTVSDPTPAYVSAVHRPGASSVPTASAVPDLHLGLNFNNVAVSFSGIQLVQRGSATATTTGLASLAIAFGEGAAATAVGGWFNSAIALGTGSSASVNYVKNNGTASGSFNAALASGGGIAAVNSASGADGATATATGNANMAWAIGGAAFVNGAQADGTGGDATATGSFNTAGSIRGTAAINNVNVQSLSATATGTATGSFNGAIGLPGGSDAEVNQVLASAAQGGIATGGATGSFNGAVSLGNSAGTVNFADTNSGTDVASATVNGYFNAAAALSHAGNADVATVNGATAMAGTAIAAGHLNTSWSAISGSSYVNIAQALVAGSSAVGSGSLNTAAAPGFGVAVVNNADDGGVALGDLNNAWTLANGKSATAGAGNANLAIAWADNAVADATGGDGMIDIEPPL